MILRVGKPEKRKNDCKARLCSRISVDTGTYDMWYEVEECYEEYLCFERADAFVAAVLPYAMREGIDIHVDAPLSEQLYYMLTTTYIPALGKNAKSFHNIRLECDVLESIELPSAGAAGTGFSGGVDSFFTLCTHLQTKANRHSLTHLTFFNVGASGDEGGEKARKLFLERQGPAKAAANANGLEFVSVDSNISEFLRHKHILTHTMRSMSAALALQKLFSVYYYSSSNIISEFSLAKADEAAGYYDIMSAYCLSNENTRFIISGPNESRLEKCAAVAEYPPSYQHLNVCQAEASNCGKCEKCERTMLEFFALGKLERYRAVFDADEFIASKDRHLTNLLANSGNRYNAEVLEKMKENGVRITAKVRILGKLKRFGYHFPGAYKRLASIKLFRRLYKKAV